jgi:hypothetical protein
MRVKDSALMAWHDLISYVRSERHAGKTGDVPLPLPIATAVAGVLAGLMTASWTVLGVGWPMVAFVLATSLLLTTVCRGTGARAFGASLGLSFVGIIVYALATW